MTELRQLARFASDFHLEQAPEAVVKAARLCVLDSVGCGLGAARYEEIPGLCKEIWNWAKSGSTWQASVWGQGFKMDVFQALLLNGIMGHALELDDVHTGSKSHIGAVVVETAWTLAEAMRENGKHFLEAVIVGYEIMARVGKAMDVVSNRKRGWHGTGVIGTFGAAAAAGHLLGLSEERMVWALGMAGTQSSGLWAFLEDGASCKKLHPARAAVNGLTAAILAKAGMSGPEHILDAKDGGLYKAVSDSYDMSVLTRGLGDTYEILNIDKKPYPCCRTTHHAIDAALALRPKVNLREIRRVLVETYEVGVLQCGSPKYPDTPVEAKFSIPYTVAAAFVRGRVSQAEFTEDVLNDPAVRSLAQKVTVVADSMFSERYPKRWGSRMTVEMEDGQTATYQVDDMSGSTVCPLTERQEIEKFKGMTCQVLGKRKSEKLMRDILNMDALEILPDLTV